MSEYPLLSRNLKRSFPFRFSVPSFVYPDSYSVNVDLLGPYVDEIELLFLDSRYEGAIPGADTILKLQELSARHDLTYNVHLPTDIDPGSRDKKERELAVETLKTVFDRARTLPVTTWTLHLPFNGLSSDLRPWHDSLAGSMNELLEFGVSGKELSIENLNYPMSYVSEILESFDLSVCLDTAHLKCSGDLLEDFWKKFGKRVEIIHLQGCEDGKDHRSLEVLPDDEASFYKNCLSSFEGTCCMEIFSFAPLNRSLGIFSKWFD